MSIYTERFMDDDIEYYSPQPLVIDTGKAKKIRNDSSKHYPNKNEAAVLRKIMSETGLSEEEIRNERKYRIQLSSAQKEGQQAKRTEIKKFYQNLIKLSCKKTGLAPQHPETLKVLNEIIKERQERSWGRIFFLNENLKTAETIVKQYAKK